MKKLILNAAVILTLMQLGSIYANGAAAKVNWLVKDGVMQGRLFLPLKIGRPVHLASEELRQYFKKMTGAELSLSWRKPEIRLKDIGIQLVVRNESEWKGKESAQAFTIETTLKPQMVNIIGNTEIAVLYGTYQYLHELGVRWFTPGEIGENVPKLKSIALKAGKKSYTPSFLERGINLSGVHKSHFDLSDPVKYRDVIHYEYDLWLIRNRIAFQRYIHRGDWFDFNKTTGSGGHGIRAILKDADPEKEPERFPLITKNNKQERCFKHGQICFTDKRNVKSAIKIAVAFFKKQEETKLLRNSDLDEVMDAFPLGLSDTTGICECKNCKRAAGAEPYRKDRLVWSFMNKVAKGLNRVMPGKKIALYVPYFELTRPPADVKIESNIVAVNCRVTSWKKNKADKPYYPFTKSYTEDVNALRKAGAELRTYNYSTWRGCPQPLHILDAVESYSKLGYRHYHAEVMTRNEQNWPILWTIAQFTWNSKKKTARLMEEYCYEYYGKAGPLVLKLIKEMDKNSREMPMMVYGGLLGTQIIMSDKLIADGRKKLSVAVRAAKGKEKARLELFNDTFEMFSQTAETYRSFCEALNVRTSQAINIFQKKWAGYKTLWEDRNLAKTCSPNTLWFLNRLCNIKITPKTEIKARKDLAGKTAKDKEWVKDLFAFAEVPASIPNLFPLPEIWKFKLDYKNEGLKQGWEKVGFSDSKGWNEISTWNFFDRQGYKGIDGRFWYRLKFKAPKFPAGKKVFLRIGSLDDGGHIYINGKLVYSRNFDKPDDWQSSFAFEVTEHLIQGKENLIAVRGFDSFGAGGIWRPCALYTD